VWRKCGGRAYTAAQRAADGTGKLLLTELWNISCLLIALLAYQRTSRLPVIRHFVPQRGAASKRNIVRFFCIYICIISWRRIRAPPGQESIRPQFHHAGDTACGWIRESKLCKSSERSTRLSSRVYRYCTGLQPLRASAMHLLAARKG
jgi:hypothetical protein